MTTELRDHNLLPEALFDSTRLWIFDFDGVMADTEPVHAESYLFLLKERGIAFTRDDFKRYIGNTEGEIFRMLEGDYGIRLEPRAASKRRAELVDSLLASSALEVSWFVRPILGRTGRGGASACILSSQALPFIERFLRSWELSGQFEKIYAAPERGRSKRELLPLIGEEFGVEPADITMLDDNAPFLEHALALGMKAVAVEHSLNKPLPGHLGFRIVIG